MRDGIDLDAGDLRPTVHPFWHYANEVTEATGRFQNASVLEAELLQRRIDRANDGRGGVVRVERRGARGIKLLGRQQLFQLLALLRPRLVAGIEDLRQAAPAHVTHQPPLLLLARRSVLHFDLFEQLDDREVVATLLFE